MNEENIGVIKRLNDKGFGFISIKGRQKDLFFHASKMKGFVFADLHEGDEVTFEGIEPTERGDQAFGIRLLIK